MRTFGNYKVPREGEKKRLYNRTSTEWDVRLDCTSLTLDYIKRTLQSNQLVIQYVMMSGMEEPDTTSFIPNEHKTNAAGNKAASSSTHVHIALITRYVMQRYQVLKLCRGDTALGEEYCVPRNKKFTYAGWFLHHSKNITKIEGQPGVYYEDGELPMDLYTVDTCKEILRMYNKFGGEDPDKRQRFVKWIDVTGPVFDDVPSKKPVALLPTFVKPEN